MTQTNKRVSRPLSALTPQRGLMESRETSLWLTPVLRRLFYYTEFTPNIIEFYLLHSTPCSERMKVDNTLSFGNYKLTRLDGYSPSIGVAALFVTARSLIPEVLYNHRFGAHLPSLFTEKRKCYVESTLDSAVLSTCQTSKPDFIVEVHTTWLLTNARYKLHFDLLCLVQLVSPRTVIPTPESNVILLVHRLTEVPDWVKTRDSFRKRININATYVRPAQGYEILLGGMQ
ncbi:hypothetical protein PHMEG_00017618 [Phytophthora megakarya]|uniref:Uncharacterized protein n=1 Tax=Phytophthora megakarya TaxID=4795 RepID=A0A225VW52_9STRA|nr:hypothetical protein PHMEG_00017618 [Phytophthora megakarya]